MIPTRDRPEAFALAYMSVASTSDASVVGYVDKDQKELYKNPPCPVFLGPRLGPVASINRLVELNPGYEFYGMIPDDARMTVSGWDQWLLEQKEMVVSPSTTQGDHVDMPFLRHEWLDRLGWFAYPGNYHTGYPTVIGVLAEAAGQLLRAPKDKFFIEHNMLPSQNPEYLREDARQLYAFFQTRFSTALSILKEPQWRSTPTTR